MEERADADSARVAGSTGSTSFTDATRAYGRAQLERLRRDQETTVALAPIAERERGSDGAREGTRVEPGARATETRIVLAEKGAHPPAAIGTVEAATDDVRSPAIHTRRAAGAMRLPARPLVLATALLATLAALYLNSARGAGPELDPDTPPPPPSAPSPLPTPSATPAPAPAPDMVPDSGSVPDSDSVPVTVPVTVTDSDSVPDSVAVPHSVAVTDSVPVPVTDSVPGSDSVPDSVPFPAPPTPEHASALLADGDYPEALAAYRRLAANAPGDGAYAVIARVLERRLRARCSGASTAHQEPCDEVTP